LFDELEIELKEAKRSIHKLHGLEEQKELVLEENKRYKFVLESNFFVLYCVLMHVK